MEELHSPAALGTLRPFVKGSLMKNQSLDFGVKYDASQRELDAKLYRQKLLEQQKQTRKPSKMSEELKKKKKMQEIDGHGHVSGVSDKASFGQCTFNMANILMGVGMLGLPYIFKSAGWIGGFFVTLLFSCVAYRTSILLGRELNGDPRSLALFDETKTPMKRLLKPIKSFPEISRQAFGPSGNILLSFALYFELFSCLCIFFVTLGDHLHTLFPMVSVTKHKIFAAFALAIPTALLRTPRLLSYLSAVGTAATACIVSAVAGSAIHSGDIAETIAKSKGLGTIETHELWNASGIPIAFGLIAFTFSGHAIIPNIYSSMAKPQDYERMIGFTFLCVTTCCLIVAASGYYMFGSMVDDQITLSLQKSSGDNNIIMKILTWLMILTAFSKFTLTAFPLGLGIEEIIAPYLASDKAMEYASSLIKIMLIGSALSVAIYVPSFSFLCSLVGLICTMLVSVIFPAAAHLKMFGPHLSLGEKILDWIFVVGGSTIAIAGTIKSV